MVRKTMFKKKAKSRTRASASVARRPRVAGPGIVKRRRYARKPTGSMAQRVLRLERTMVRTVMERIQCIRGIDYTSLAPISMFPLITPSSIGSGRTFTGVADSILETQAYLNKINLTVLFRPTLDSGLAATNTPFNEPVMVRLFVCNLKWSIRQTVDTGTGPITNVFAQTQMVKGVHYDYGNATTLPYFTPMLNPEYFSVLGYKDYRYVPSVIATNTTTSTSDPALGVKMMKFNITPKCRLDNKSGPWNGLEIEDVPFSRQVYVVMLAHSTVLSTGSIPFKIGFALNYNLTQVQGR